MGGWSDAQGTSIKALLSVLRTHAKLFQLTQFILPKKLRVILSDLMTSPWRKDIFHIAHATTRGFVLVVVRKTIEVLEVCLDLKILFRSPRTYSTFNELAQAHLSRIRLT